MVLLLFFSFFKKVPELLLTPLKLKLSKIMLDKLPEFLINLLEKFFRFTFSNFKFSTFAFDSSCKKVEELRFPTRFFIN